MELCTNFFFKFEQKTFGLLFCGHRVIHTLMTQHSQPTCAASDIKHQPTLHSPAPSFPVIKVKVVNLYTAYTWNVSSALGYSTHCQAISQFYLHTLRFIRKRNDPYLLLRFQSQLVLIYRPRMDGRLSRPWCEVVPAEIRTRNLPITSLTLYHTATIASRGRKRGKREGGGKGGVPSQIQFLNVPVLENGYHLSIFQHWQIQFLNVPVLENR